MDLYKKSIKSGKNIYLEPIQDGSQINNVLLSWAEVCHQILFTEKYVLVRKCLEIGLSWAVIKKTVHVVEIYRLSGKGKVPDAIVSKESHADSIQGHERTHHYWFDWKRYNYSQ